MKHLKILQKWHRNKHKCQCRLWPTVAIAESKGLNAYRGVYCMTEMHWNSCSNATLLYGCPCCFPTPTSQSKQVHKTRSVLRCAQIQRKENSRGCTKAQEVRRQIEISGRKLRWEHIKEIFGSWGTSRAVRWQQWLPLMVIITKEKTQANVLYTVYLHMHTTCVVAACAKIHKDTTLLFPVHLNAPFWH